MLLWKRSSSSLPLASCYSFSLFSFVSCLCRIRVNHDAWVDVMGNPCAFFHWLAAERKSGEAFAWTERKFRCFGHKNEFRTQVWLCFIGYLAKKVRAFSPFFFFSFLFLFSIFFLFFLWWMSDFCGECIFVRWSLRQVLNVLRFWY